MIDKAAAGELIDFLDQPAPDLPAMQAWGPERTIRAAVLRRLLVEPEPEPEPEPAWPVHAKGVRLRGVRISGRMDLEGATLRCPLRLSTCFLDDAEPVQLTYATASLLGITDSHLAGLQGDRLVVTQELDLGGSTFTQPIHLLGAEITGQLDCRGAQLQGRDADGNALLADGLTAGGDMCLNEGFTAAGTIRLLGAKITGQLSCRGAQLHGRDADGNALLADWLTAGRSVLLDRGFTAVGAIRLSGAEITGQLSCRGAQLHGRDADGDAVVADGLTVGRDAFLDEGFTAVGAIRLLGAKITGQLDCRGAQLQGRDADGNALLADGLTAGGDVFLNEGFTAAGTIRLSGAKITGQLSCRGAQLHGRNADGNALLADGLTAGRDVFLDRGFTAAGAITLSAAQIGGSCSFVGAQLADDVALRAEGLKIGHELHWAPRAPVAGEVNLERAATHRLVDNWTLPDAHWPGEGRLRLTGFTYDGFGGNSPASWKQRLGWVRRSSSASTDRRELTFATQPYEQLIRIYRQSGLEADARRVAIAKRNDLRGHGGLTRVGRAGNWMLDKTIRHGYQPLRAAALLAVVYLAVVLALWTAQHRPSLVVPAKDVGAIDPAPTAERCVDGYPCFYPAGYAVDAVIPLLNLRQVENWRLNGSADWGWAFIAGTWVATGLGWAFSTLAVVGYTGLVRKD